MRRNEGRTVGLYTKVSPEEKAVIDQKMAALGSMNLRAYLRKMAVDGYVVHLDMSSVCYQTEKLEKLQSALEQSQITVTQVDKMQNAIIQIIPAPADMRVVYKEDDGELSQYRALCLALVQYDRRGTEVRIMDVDAYGVIEFADTASNFDGVAWKEATP